MRYTLTRPSIVPLPTAISRPYFLLLLFFFFLLVRVTKGSDIKSPVVDRDIVSSSSGVGSRCIRAEHYLALCPRT